MRRILCSLALLLPACATDSGAEPPPHRPEVVSAIPSEGPFTLTGLTQPGGAPIRIAVAGGRITGLGPDATAGPLVALDDLFVAPAFIDSHVHLAYLPRAEELAAGGIALAVDLAAPLPFLAERPSSPRVLASGPMVTAVGGYPTRSWGAGGFGLECAGEAEAVAAVDSLADAGAALIKVPLHGDPEFDDATLAAIVSRAHARSLLVTAHALTDDGARRAAEAGVDLLAHTPVYPLTDPTVAAWSGRAVISTLRAFGGSETAVDNLRRLRAAGATVLYGTDFGNTRFEGIDPDELALLGSAGLDPSAVLASGTSAAATFWGVDDLGGIAVGKAASLLLLDADPLQDPSTLGRPVAVILDGRAVQQASSRGWP